MPDILKEVKSMPEKPSYEALGVSHQKEDVHAALEGVDHGLFPDAFCRIIPDLAGDPTYCSIMHADGAGTKSAVAYMMYKETGDLKYFRGIVHDSVVMNTDDVLCVGATGPFFLSNTIGRNKKRIGGEIIQTIIHEYEQFAKHLQTLGLPLYTTGGETADVGDLVRTLIVDSTLVTRMSRNDVILPVNIKPGDVIVGLTSTGKATYEPDLAYNSGIGSNGLTLARHGVLHHAYFTKFPEAFGPELEERWVFFGQHALTDPLPGTPLTIGEAILSPTRTYAPILLPLLREHRAELHAIFHCTGGGQTKCGKFGTALHYIKDNLFPIPPFFDLIQKSSNTPWQEMYQVFNMGHRMELLCSQSFATDILIPLAKKFAVDARIVGHVEKAKGIRNEITIESAVGKFYYTL
jgi:phosphoribosylformylglycinamidine cyclo-ligase